MAFTIFLCKMWIHMDEKLKIANEKIKNLPSYPLNSDCLAEALSFIMYTISQQVIIIITISILGQSTFGLFRVHGV